MSATSAPFGLRPAYHPTGEDRASAYTIASAYGTALYKGTPVILNTNGTITVATTGADWLGAFDGVEYTDSLGKPTLSNFWPASTVATAITAWVWDNPVTVFDIQADGAVAQTAIGDQADFAATPGSGSTSTGLSTAKFSASLVGASSQGQMRVIGFNLDPGNVIGDAFTVVQVQNARHQYVANKVAI